MDTTTKKAKKERRRISPLKTSLKSSTGGVAAAVAGGWGDLVAKC
jgi:hypothetical protein